MLKQHKNTLFQIISNSTIDETRFYVSEIDEFTLNIKLLNSPIVFMLKQFSNNFDVFSINYSEFKPGFPLYISEHEFEIQTQTHHIEDIFTQFHEWLNDVAFRYLKEQEITDFWAEAQTQFSFSQSFSIPEEELISFSEGEKVQIKKGIEDFRESIKEKFNPVEEQLKAINERLDYLGKAVDRLNRFDWKAQLISTLISIGVNLGVDKESGKQLLNHFQQTLGTIVSKLIQLQIPPLIQ